MRLFPGIFACVVLLSIAGSAQAGDPSDSIYHVVRHDLMAARAAATIRETTARLLTHPEIRHVAALRKFVTGCAALVSYDRATAERHLAESFRRAPSAHVAAALAANAIEIGDPGRVLRWIQQAVRAGDAQLEPALDVDLRLMRGQALGWLAKYEEWRDEAATTVQRARSVGDSRLLARALRSHAEALLFAGDTRLGTEMFQDAFRMSEAAGDTAAIGYQLLTRSPFGDLSTHGKLQALDGALGAARQIRDRQLEGRALGGRGAVLMLLGQYDQARRDLTAADALLREIGALRSRATVAGNLSLLFTELGDYARAEQQARLATRLYRLVGNQSGARQALDGLGTLALARGDLSLAVSRHQHVVDMTREWGDTVYLRGALVRLGRAYLAQGEYAAAERHVREGLGMFAAAPQNLDGLASAHMALGDVLRKSGRAADAEYEYRRALALAPRMMSQTALLPAHHGLGLLDAQAGRWSSALAHFRTAIGEIERGRDGAGQSALQIAYFAEKSALYVDAIETLVDAYRHTADAGLLREALVVAERAKARTLFDAVKGGAHPAASEAVYSVEEMARTLEPSDLLIEFVIGQRRSFVFTLAADASLTVEQLPARAVIEQQVRALRDLITRRPAPGADLERVRRAASRAYTALLAPALARPRESRGLPGIKRLIIVADGLVFYAPFEAFVIDASGTYLAEQFDLVRAASVSVLTATRKRRASATLSRFVGFGDPRVTGARQPEAELVRALEREGFSFAPLPASRREIEAAATALQSGDTRLYTGAAFTAAAVLAELQRPNRIVHFATHAILDERVPDRSGILLTTAAGESAPAILRARDLAGLSIPVDLVTLSACQTGLGQIVAGEGVLGLAWAFTRAGASSLIVTLWNVSDASSAATMIAFYRALAAGQSKSAALRSARLAILDNPALRHPYFWAGHVLIGDPS